MWVLDPPVYRRKPSGKSPTKNTIADSDFKPMLVRLLIKVTEVSNSSTIYLFCKTGATTQMALNQLVFTDSFHNAQAARLSRLK
jgi:hypothetical protein